MNKRCLNTPCRPAQPAQQPTVKQEIKLNIVPNSNLLGRHLSGQPVDRTTIYVERQRGGLCRLHAINAFFGEQKFSEHEFWAKASEFDSERKSIDTNAFSCRDFDAGSNNNLVSYILSKEGICLRWLPCRDFKSIDLGTGTYPYKFFVFSTDHIWVIAQHDADRYTNIDSMSGATETSWQRVTSDRSVIGAMFPVDVFTEFADSIHDIVLLSDSNWSLAGYLAESKRQGLVMGSLEVLMSRVMFALGIILPKVSSAKKKSKIIGVLELYKKFMNELTMSNKYNDLEFLSSNIDRVLIALVNDASQ